jgi:hypothetical protein
MKQPYILYILFLLSLSSCEKVIDLDLNDSEKKYVIEGRVTDQAGGAIVRISQTKNFDENNDFPPVSGAIVTITETGGPTVTLPESQPGIYESALLTGSSGKTYALSVSIGSNTFTAISAMPRKVALDSIFITDEQLFTNTRKTVNAVFNDPPGMGDCYRFVQYVNGLRESQVMIRNDDYSDARTIINKLFYFTGDDDYSGKIESGDAVTIEMLCIDRNIYKYWFSLDRSATGISGQATPSNPVSNIQGGALGYFSAHTYEEKNMVAP